MGDVVYKLTALPAAEESEHKFFIMNNLKDLEACEEHQPIIFKAQFPLELSLPSVIVSSD